LRRRVAARFWGDSITRLARGERFRLWRLDLRRADLGRFDFFRCRCARWFLSGGSGGGRGRVRIAAENRRAARWQVTIGARAGGRFGAGRRCLDRRFGIVGSGVWLRSWARARQEAAARQKIGPGRLFVERGVRRLLCAVGRL
jgi:hypothetical protein